MCLPPVFILPMRIAPCNPTCPFARWFCDITLRRLAKTLSQRGPSARTDNYDEDSPDPEEVVPAEPLDGTSGWGAASAPTPNAAEFTGVAAVETPGAGLRVSEASRVGGGTPGSHSRFRTFTVMCALTGVTEKGARVAEAMSPGLMVVFKE